jgi:hypothetical protein
MSEKKFDISAGSKKPKIDVRIENHGSLVGVQPISAAGRNWINENVASEPWQWFGGALMVEHRYAGAIVAGLNESGLVAE